MYSHKGAGTFAIQIKIANVKFAACPVKTLLRAGVKCPGQAKLSIVCDLESVVEITSFNDRENRGKYLLLYGRPGFYIVNNCRFDIETLAVVAIAARQTRPPSSIPF